jgi:Domain of unknown function (DUF5122) beta-propeller
LAWARHCLPPESGPAGDLFVLPAHAEFTPEGQPDCMVTPAAITASSHRPGATFLASGGYVLAASPTVARHDADIQVQRFNADGTVAAATVLIQPDGKIIAVGFSENNSTGVTDVFLARYPG